MANLCVVALAGCGHVPELTFVDPIDASITNDASDAGVDSAVTATDGGVAVCPTSPPIGADICCGNIACSGTCSANNCANCVTMCGPNQLCCGRPNGIQCRAMGSKCP